MKGYRTKRIALPGGRVIEIVYFAEPAEGEDMSPPGEGAPLPAAYAESAEPPARNPALHECPACRGHLVYPVSWEERADERWRIDRRCPDCEWRGEGEHDNPAVEAFDDALNDGTEALLLELRRFSRANMESDIECFIAAINEDLIQPMDF